MVKLKKKLVLFIIIILIGYYSNFTSSETRSSKDYITDSLKLFIDHDPIEILNDTAFTLYGFEGGGTEESPYIIENLKIESFGFLSNSIYVTGTSAHFIIRNCYLLHEYVGIYVHDISPYTSQLINNTCIGTVEDMGGSIGVSNTVGCSIIDNTCVNVAQGIHTNEANHITITGNVIENSTYQGINIRFSYSNNVTYNKISNCEEFGIALVGGTTYYNLIHHNTLIDNGLSGTYIIDNERSGNITSQAYDEGTQNTWYDEETKEGNFWSDYSGKSDYAIDGPTESFDIYPMKVGETGNLYLIFICMISMIVLAVNRRLLIKKR